MKRMGGDQGRKRKTPLKGNKGKTSTIAENVKGTILEGIPY